MSQKGLSDKLKKNILDAAYQKNLQYFNTCIILGFTFIIAVMIGFVTQQIDYKKVNQVGIVVDVSIAVMGIIIILLLKFNDGMKSSLEDIKKLNL